MIPNVADPYQTVRIAPLVFTSFFENDDSNFSAIYELLEAYGEPESQSEGLRSGHSTNDTQNGVAKALLLYRNYLSANPEYPLHHFKHKYCIIYYQPFDICSKLEQRWGFSHAKKVAFSPIRFDAFKKATAALQKWDSLYLKCPRNFFTSASAWASLQRSSVRSTLLTK